MPPRLSLNLPVVTTLLELADATSHNLDFAHRPGVRVSYGEETITETNLLEITPRHPQRTRLQMFSKHQETLNGADWEWHIVGRRRTLKMRVQAKRLQCNDVLRVKHKVASSGKQQRQLLIDAALADRMKPVYCIYCTEHQRSIWTQTTTPDGLNSYQLGCLLADAAKFRFPRDASPKSNMTAIHGISCSSDPSTGPSGAPTHSTRIPTARSALCTLRTSFAQPRSILAMPAAR